jgi:hypothetical protein
MSAGGRKGHDRGMLAASTVAALLGALLVELRHRTLETAVAQEPWMARSRRTQFLLETWALTTPSLVLLVLAQTQLA